MAKISKESPPMKTVSALKKTGIVILVIVEKKTDLVNRLWAKKLIISLQISAAIIIMCLKDTGELQAIHVKEA